MKDVFRLFLLFLKKTLRLFLVNHFIFDRHMTITFVIKMVISYVCLDGLTRKTIAKHQFVILNVSMEIVPGLIIANVR